jgi:hypothetical protein
MSLIEAKGLAKHFKVLNRREGLTGAMRDLFSADYRIVKAVDDISFAIQPGEIVGYIGPNGAGKSTTISSPFTPRSSFCDQRRYRSWSTSPPWWALLSSRWPILCGTRV